MKSAASVFLILLSMSAHAEALTLSCVQQSRTMCEHEKGCKSLNDVAPNQWRFTFAPMKEGEFTAVQATRCSAGKCSAPFVFMVKGSISQELFGWEHVSNETFAFSSDRRQFSHSLTGSHGDGGHVVSEFGYCTSE